MLGDARPSNWDAHNRSSNQSALLTHRPTTLQKVMYGDLVLVNKADLAESDDALARLTETVRGLNPSAQIAQTTHCNVDLALVVPSRGEEPSLSEAHLRSVDSSRLQDRASHDRSVTR